MRKRKDTFTDGSDGPAGRSGVTVPVVAAAVVVAALVGVVIGAAVLGGSGQQSSARTGKPSTVTSTSTLTPTPTTPPTPSTSSTTPAPSTPPSTPSTPSTSAPFTGDDPHSEQHDESLRTPPEAATTVRRFVAAWRLDAPPAQRVRALRRVATPYLARALDETPQQQLPSGRVVTVRLEGGGPTEARYRVDFRGGEKSLVSVRLVRPRVWLVSRVDPIEGAGA